MARITITRAVWNKCMTQLQKPENEAAVKLLRATKRTQNPKSDEILWDPSADALNALKNQIEREMSFTRDKESAPYKALVENLGRINGELKRLDAVPSPATSAPTAP